MVEQGFVMYVQAGLAALSTPPIAPGGWADELPKDQISAANPMAWCYAEIADKPSGGYTLDGEDSTTDWTIYVHSHGLTRPLAMKLDKAIRTILRGAPASVFPDPDSTRFQGIFRLPFKASGFSDANRSYVVTRQYRITYDQI